MWFIGDIWWDFTTQNWLIQSFMLSSILSTLICFIMVTYMKFTKAICKTELKLYGKTALITGASSGEIQKQIRIAFFKICM